MERIGRHHLHAEQGSDHPTLFSADALVQTGLRASSDTIANGIVLPTHATM
jgi:hypothetical protein